MLGGTNRNGNLQGQPFLESGESVSYEVFMCVRWKVLET
jgi:hypothetical protein